MQLFKNRKEIQRTCYANGYISRLICEQTPFTNLLSNVTRLPLISIKCAMLEIVIWIFAILRFLHSVRKSVRMNRPRTSSQCLREIQVCKGRQDLRKEIIDEKLLYYT